VLDAVPRYARHRRQFGKAISEFQAIQCKLATMATELDAAWLLTMRAAHRKDRGEKVTLAASMAKLHASEAACRICDEGSRFTADTASSRTIQLKSSTAT
jgi:alkylation response protein AidB-like acyl-CoA dehydrogenase